MGRWACGGVQKYGWYKNYHQTQRYHHVIILRVSPAISSVFLYFELCSLELFNSEHLSFCKSVNGLRF